MKGTTPAITEMKTTQGATNETDNFVSLSVNPNTICRMDRFIANSYLGSSSGSTSYDLLAIPR